MLLPTKLYVPQLAPDTLPRPRLLEVLRDADRSRLVLVSAPAGSGKTTLVASWVAHLLRPVGWISLDAADDDPATFLGYLAEALEPQAPAVAERAQALLASTPPPDARAVATLLAVELAARARGAADERIFIVLDDYHVIGDGDIHAMLTLLLDRAPLLTFVLITRSDPPLPLARLRARRQLCEVREADLRFDDAEASALISCFCERELRPESLAALTGRTEGWAAGLQLAALALRGADDPDSFVAAFQGTHAYIADYLTDEVLARIPADQHRFLVRSSLLDRLTGPLCDDALGVSGSQALLESLSRANLFLVPLDGERRWFRYHHLFADLLRRRALEEAPDARADVLRRAAVWCDANGVIDDAVAYALRAGDTSYAADVIARHGIGALAAGEALRALRWVRALPAEIVHASPDHCVIAGWSHTLVENYAVVQDLAGRALDRLALGAREYPSVDDAALHARTLQAGAGALDGSPAAAEAALRALHAVLAEAGEHSLPVRASAEIMCGKLLCNLGRYDAALPHHERARDLGERLGSDLLRFAAVTGTVKTLLVKGDIAGATGRAAAELERRQALREILGVQVANLHSMIALARLERNEPERARDALQRAWHAMGADPLHPDAWRVMLRLDRARHVPFHSTTPLSFFGLNAHIRLLLRTGDTAEARHCFAIAERSVGVDAPHAVRVVIEALRVRIMIALGETSRLQRWPRLDLALASGSRFWDDVAVLTNARAALRTGDGASAAADAQRLLDEDRDAFVGRGDALLLQAIACHALGRHAEAGHSIDQALEVTAVQERFGLWIEAGAAVAPLLERAVDRAAARPFALAFATDVLASLRADADGRDEAAGALSDRELAVLRLLAAGHSNRDIAEALFLAVGTVKKHTHNIYAKLGVTNRTGAVREGRGRGIL